MASKINVAVFFGGQSCEHEISIQSARNVVGALDRNRYDIHLIAIDHQGHWFLQQANGKQLLAEEQPIINQQQPVILNNGKSQALVGIQNQSLHQPIDVALPILHGPMGEDGTIQGLLKLANIPFIGPDVLASALCMDKDVMKRLLRDANINTAPFITLRRSESLPETATIIQQLGLPCFIKPANMGSSVGISKASTEAELAKAIDYAFNYDHKILVEKAIEGREIECAILGNENPRASLPGEIIPQHEFYSYEAKYLDDNGAILSVPAELTDKQITLIQQTALNAFQALQCEGMARVDTFLTPKDEVIINEVNTIPGFTQISMYPKMWQASGLSYSALLDELIQLALQRQQRQQALQTHYNQHT